jgi:hypothetical protein
MADEPPGKADSPFGESPGQSALMETHVAAGRCSDLEIAPESGKWRHFGIDFEPFWGIIRPKTAKKGPKSGSYSYSSVNYVFWYSVHYYVLMFGLASKMRLKTHRGGGG